MAKRLKKEKVNVDVINFGEQVTSHETTVQTQAQIPQFSKCLGDLTTVNCCSFLSDYCRK